MLVIGQGLLEELGERRATEIMEMLEAEISAAITQTREEDAGLVCDSCNYGLTPKYDGHNWIHDLSDGFEPCQASAIWEKNEERG